MPVFPTVELVSLRSDDTHKVWSASVQWPGGPKLGTNQALPTGSTPAVYVWHNGDGYAIDIINLGVTDA